MPNKFDLAKDDIRMQGVIVDIDAVSGKANSIERFSIKLKDS
jgi:calcineurin-like phosphoesterase